VRKELRVQQVQQVRLALRVQLGHKALQVLQAHKVLRVLKGLLPVLAWYLGSITVLL
jgi:hypothetical protein